MAATYLHDLIKRRRIRPCDDLLTTLAEADADGRRLTDEEITAISQLLLLAGHETTTGLLGNAVLALLRHGDECRRLRGDSGLIGGAADELLRYDTPLQGLLRVATAEVEYGGKRIKEGQTILLWLGAANRDPAHFPEPDHLDITRRVRHHVAFGYGSHFCLGAPLARTMVEIAVATLLRRFSDLRLAAGATEWQGNILFRSLRALYIETEPNRRSRTGGRSR